MNVVSKKTVDDKEIGKVIIADEVIATIASTAATEINGVYSTPSGVNKSAIINWINKKGHTKDCFVEVVGNEIQVDISLVICAGFNITSVSEEVQDKIKNALEVMTGMNVSIINISIVGILENTTEN